MVPGHMNVVLKWMYLYGGSGIVIICSVIIIFLICFILLYVLSVCCLFVLCVLSVCCPFVVYLDCGDWSVGMK